MKIKKHVSRSLKGINRQSVDEKCDELTKHVSKKRSSLINRRRNRGRKREWSGEGERTGERERGSEREREKREGAREREKREI